MDYDFVGNFPPEMTQPLNKEKRDKWDKRFLRMAAEYGSWSKDPSTKVGALIVNPETRRILSGGFNGFPSGVKDVAERLNNREEKYKLTVHAEMNAIYNATLNGVSLSGATLYCVGLPVCSGCVLGIIQVGIKRIVMGVPEVIPQKWEESWITTKFLLNEVGINFKFYHDWKENE